MSSGRKAMMTKKNTNHSKFALLSGSCLAIALTSPVIASAQEADEEETLVAEKVIVTALKREGQTAIDAPAAVSVIGGDELDSLAATSLTDFLQLAPGVALDESSTGAGNANIGIRGVNAAFGAGLRMEF